MAVTVENGYKISEVPLMSAQDIDGNDLFIVADNDGNGKFHSRSMQAQQLAKFVSSSDSNKEAIQNKVDEKASQLDEKIQDVKQTVNNVQQTVQENAQQAQNALNQTAQEIQSSIQEVKDNINDIVVETINENVIIQQWMSALDEDTFILSCGASQ